MKTSVVIGANRGIGLELCRALASRGDRVVGVCRSPSKELSSTGAQMIEGIDVTSSDAGSILAAKLPTTVDLLVVSAGVLDNVPLGDLDFDRIRAQIEINALGPLRLAAALAPRMDRGSKIAFLTSRMGSIEDNTSGGSYGYRMSKAALNMAGRSLAHDLKGRGIAVVLLHPGYVRTSMTGNNGNVGPEESAASLVKRIDELTLESSGTFMHMNGEKLPW